MKTKLFLLSFATLFAFAGFCQTNGSTTSGDSSQLVAGSNIRKKISVLTRAAGAAMRILPQATVLQTTDRVASTVQGAVMM